MPHVTYYVAIPFHADDEGSAVAGEPRECQEGGKAKRMAAILAADPKNCGAVAFSRTGDPATGDFEEAVILTQIGDVDSSLIAR